MLSGKGVAFCHILNVCDVMRVQSIAYQYPCHPLTTPTTADSEGDGRRTRHPRPAQPAGGDRKPL